MVVAGRMNPRWPWLLPPSVVGIATALSFSFTWVELIVSYVGLPCCLGKHGYGNHSLISSTVFGVAVML
jgi:hypothetical protein